jgi:hypothetical protein
MAVSKHRGSCHCGAVRYTVELDIASPSLSCNCSMCGRSGTLLQFVSPEQFTLEAGETNLTDYQFNKHVIHHTFCKTCGIKPFARGQGPKGPTIAINMRTLEDVDVTSLPTNVYDGKHH